jgi:hypothetical protein
LPHRPLNTCWHIVDGVTGLTEGVPDFDEHAEVGIGVGLELEFGIRFGLFKSF